MGKNKMILRSGMYTVYRNRVYEINKWLDRDGRYIYIHNKEDMDDKCIRKDGYVIRPITSDDVGEVYGVSSYAIYKGYKVALRGKRIAEKMAIGPTDIDNTDCYEVIKALDIPEVDRGDYTMFVPAKDLDFYERVKYYDKYGYFNGTGKPYKVEDYHVIIKDGELHRHKME